MQITIINGTGGSGKDTFVSYCKELLEDKSGLTTNCLNVSTVDYVKEIAGYCGWNGEKDPASRKFLSQLKDAMTEWRDLPVIDVKGQINRFEQMARWCGTWDKAVVFVHCREPEEIARLVDELNAKALLIRRESAENIQQINHADNNVLNYEYDYTIYNNGTKEELKEEARRYLTEFLGLNI